MIGKIKGNVKKFHLQDVYIALKIASLVVLPLLKKKPTHN